MAGVYDPSGALRVTAVDGQTLSGLYASDGSYNVVIQNAGDPLEIVTNDLNTETVSADSIDTVSLTVASDITIDADTDDVAQIGFSGDTFLKRLSAGLLAIVNGTSAMGLTIYNTYTSASVYERAFFRWATDILEFGTEMVGGTLRSIRIVAQSVIIRTAGTDRVNFGASQVICSTDGGYAIGGAANRFSRLVLQPTALASLPTASAAGAGAIAIASDLNSTTFNATAADGGSNVMLVHSDGTNWKIG